MMIQADLLVLTPFFVGFLAAMWILLQRLVFRPLDKISKSLEKFQYIQGKEQTKVAVLESKVENFLST